ncbi:PaaI family thioesterase [Microbulbifer bruguierae]|uniref:PaaI family thioesterase n=1 Tax=Microbulbifer bruguierae TaxID=3029061 RepID=A0ABY8NEB6_9GAMM|nr:PaaI family thioesterase [Microbulbifer bruguierae]WGL16734.1 PaaI family thioesterase [Microbulbifer bruguierae]
MASKQRKIADITDEPHRGAIGDLRVLQQPGLETFRKFTHQELPAPPVWRLTGIQATEVGLGSATFSMPVTPWLEDFVGVYWGGLYALFADSPLAAAIWTTLPQGKALSTSELTLCYVRPMSAETPNIIGRAKTVHSGSQVGLSSVEILDHQGRMLAFGSSRCLISDFPVDKDATFPEPDLGPTNGPDPYQRPPPEAHVEDLAGFGTVTPIQCQRDTIQGGGTHPVWHFTGYRVRAVEDGYCEAALPSSPWFSNGNIVIYGGMLAWAADFTMGAAVYSTLPAGDIFATLDLHIRFMRPAALDDGDIILIGRVHHRGKQLRVASCDIVNAQGKRLAMATASALLIPDGARQISQGLPAERIIAHATESMVRQYGQRTSSH